MRSSSVDSIPAAPFAAPSTAIPGGPRWRSWSSVLLPCALWLCAAIVFGCGCGGVTRLVPRGGDPVAEVQGKSGRLRVYTLPPSQLPALQGVLLVYVELTNKTRHSLRVSYDDLYLRPGAPGAGRSQPAQGQPPAAASQEPKDPRIGPLPPGDVLRPDRLSRSQRRLFASLDPGVLFGRGLLANPRPQGPPEAVSDFVTDQADRSPLDITLPTARSWPNSLWVTRNDYDRGPQLDAAGWNYFGLPQAAGSMSLFDVLISTLPDGALLPGASVGGFLFFPESARTLPDRGLRWEVHDAVNEQPYEVLSLPLGVAP